MNRRNALQVLATAAGMTQIPGHALEPKAGMDQSIVKRKIPSSGELLPVLGLGTWQTFDVANDAAARAPLGDVLREFSALGGKLIDSSPMYGRSEEVAGDLIAKIGAREKLFIATKVWASTTTHYYAYMIIMMFSTTIDGGKRHATGQTCVDGRRPEKSFGDMLQGKAASARG